MQPQHCRVRFIICTKVQHCAGPGPNSCTKFQHCAGSGPTKAHRLHLRHVIKQLRALEKRLAGSLNKHAGHFLELLAKVRDRVSCTAHLLLPFYLLLETTDSHPFRLSLPSIVCPTQKCTQKCWLLLLCQAVCSCVCLQATHSKNIHTEWMCKACFDSCWNPWTVHMPSRAAHGAQHACRRLVRQQRQALLHAWMC